MNLDFSNIKVLLIGDFMIDHYIMGTSSRMSPEAPVPIILPEKEYSIPGGTGNVAMNICVMGGYESYKDNLYHKGVPFIFCIGAIGTDEWGDKLLSILKGGTIKEYLEDDSIRFIHHHDQIDVSKIIQGDLPKYDLMDPRRELDTFRGYIYTIVKERTYLKEKQIYRLDREYSQYPLVNNFEVPYLEEINNSVSTTIKNCDIVILSDYNKGVLNDDTIPHVLNEAKKHNIPVIVDPKKDDFSIYKGANIITPNLNELQRASKIEINDNKSLVSACNELIQECNFNYIIAKKGDKGMTIVGKDNFVKHIKAHPVENPDVTGAGDTVVAALSLAFAKTNDIELSARVANDAAALVVGKLGTATVTIDEINNYISIDE